MRFSVQWCGFLQAQAGRGKYPELTAANSWLPNTLWLQKNLGREINAENKGFGFSGYVIGALCAEGFKYSKPYINHYFWAGIKKLRR